MKSYLISLIVLYLFSLNVLTAQDKNFTSIHQEQSEYYKSLGFKTAKEYDSLNNFKLMPKNERNKNCTLNKIVFGYHPYWMGSAFLNYQWNLLSDLCYFSYEVNPQTGNPVTTHNWLNAKVIDSAQANGVRVHLCATLFSDITTFLTNSSAKQNLINNLISLIQQHNADGVNIDFEGIPSSQSDNFTNFLIDLSEKVHNAIQGSIVSIAVPAVDWGNVFNTEILKNYLDYFIIMGYDYYCNGSSQAGPVDGLYSMTIGYDYNLSRTISNYLYKGIPNSKYILGLPYYGREWETESNSVPSNTIGWGRALTYSNVRNNSSGHYTNDNKYWEQNSFTPYYSYNSDGWYQCFIDDSYSLAKRYEVVNQRGIAGIGIWALGYDNGYTELWDDISNKFTNCATSPCSDTIYDSGGPGFDYYDNEDYCFTIAPTNAISVSLNFSSFDLQSGCDSLWIYDGPNIYSSLIGGYSGNNNPGIISSTGNALTLRFYSDNARSYSGWQAIWDCALQIDDSYKNRNNYYIKVFPNPFKNNTIIYYTLKSGKNVKITITDLSGNLIKIFNDEKQIQGTHQLTLNLKTYAHYSSGIYLLNFYINNQLKKTIRLINYSN